MRAISYLRFSRLVQAAGRSEHRQSETADSFCRRKGWTLDATVYADRGRSAWKNRHAETGQLGLLLDAIKEEKIKPGDVIIVESCDRLSRAGIRKALNIWLSILDAGVSIQTLEPERFYDTASTNDIAGLIEPLIYFSRANEESETKSVRVKEAWAKRVQVARETRRPTTSRCPKWLSPVKVEGRPVRFVANAERAEIVRRIFGMALEGIGCFTIAKTLNREGVDAWGQPGWVLHYILDMLTSRTVLGEYQPRTKKDNPKVASPGSTNVGEPIPDYYPAVVDAETFWRVQDIILSRKNKEMGRRRVGVQGKRISNLFWGNGLQKQARFSAGDMAMSLFPGLPRFLPVPPSVK